MSADDLGPEGAGPPGPLGGVLVRVQAVAAVLVVATGALLAVSHVAPGGLLESGYSPVLWTHETLLIVIAVALAPNPTAPSAEHRFPVAVRPLCLAACALAVPALGFWPVAFALAATVLASEAVDMYTVGRGHALFGLALTFVGLAVVGVLPPFGLGLLLLASAHLGYRVWSALRAGAAVRRLPGALHVVLYLQGAAAWCVVELTRGAESFVLDTLLVSGSVHLLLLSALIPWLRRLGEQVPARVRLVGLSLVGLGIHVFTWSHLFLGREGMPRRMLEYPDQGALWELHVVGALGSALVVVGLNLMAVAAVRASRVLPSEEVT